MCNETTPQASLKCTKDDSMRMEMIVEEKNRKEEKAALVNTLRSDDAKILQQMSQVNHSERSFLLFRTQYLVVFAAIMLADGLQGTHLYVLYETYGYCVSSLYALGFASGAFTSLFIGAIVDNLGRKRAVLMYCILEIIINYLEQYPSLICITISRLIGGITTNLLFTVFEAWVVTEHRRRKLEESKLEDLFRDSNLVSNSAAIISGYIAHCLASTSLGPVGPFVGAVVFTFLALLIVSLLWCENYGNDDDNNTTPSLRDYIKNASDTIWNNPDIAYLGLIHGLTEGSLQTFVFLWSPMLQKLASTSSSSTNIGLDRHGEPAYGLIFGAFMIFGVIGNYTQPIFLRWITKKITQAAPSCLNDKKKCVNTNNDDSRRNMISIYILTSGCYMFGSLLFLIPYAMDQKSQYSFIVVLGAFLLYEFFVGTFMTSQSIIRSVHIPSDSKCSIMMMLRFLTNVAVSIGVVLSNHIPMGDCFGVLALMMITASVLQLSFIPNFHQRKLKGD